MITLNNISITLQGKTILKNISTVINQGDFITIIGQNGSGKSTLFNTIAGRIPLSSGNMLFHDQDITHLPEQRRAQFISRLFQNPLDNNVSSMTVKENIALSMLKNKIAGLQGGLTNYPEDLLQTMLAPLNITINHLLNKPMQELSGGQRQILSFIMAILTKPSLLLLDEPTAALDPASATKLLLAVTNHMKNNFLTTLMITHDPHLAIILGNRLWVLQDGTIIKDFHQEEKQRLSPEQLLGEIDYQSLKKAAAA